MHVRVDQSRQNDFPSKVVLFRPGMRERSNHGVATHRHDPTALNRKCFMDGKTSIRGDDFAGMENGVRQRALSEKRSCERDDEIE